MNRHDRAAVSIEEWMGVGERAEHLARVPAHVPGVQSHVEAVFRGSAYVGRVREQVGQTGFGDGEVGRQGGTVLPGPGIDRTEEYSMCILDLLVSGSGGPLQSVEGWQYIRCEGVRLEAHDHGWVVCC
jgi:hypothetical protein